MKFFFKGERYCVWSVSGLKVKTAAVTLLLRPAKPHVRVPQGGLVVGDKGGALLGFVRQRHRVRPDVLLRQSLAGSWSPLVYNSAQYQATGEIG